MLHEFARSENLSDKRELLLGGIVGSDGAVRPIGAVEIPGVETSKVLDGPEELVAADCGV